MTRRRVTGRNEDARGGMLAWCHRERGDAEDLTQRRKDAESQRLSIPASLQFHPASKFEQLVLNCFFLLTSASLRLRVSALITPRSIVKERSEQPFISRELN